CRHLKVCLERKKCRTKAPLPKFARRWPTNGKSNHALKNARSPVANFGTVNFFTRFFFTKRTAFAAKIFVKTRGKIATITSNRFLSGGPNLSRHRHPRPSLWKNKLPKICSGVT